MSIKLKLDQVFEELDIPQAIKRSSITYDMDIKKEQTCIGIRYGGKNYPIGTYGNFSATVGKAKARKSFALALFMAAAVKVGFIKIIEARTAGKNNILFDTEQSKYHVYWYNRRVVSICEKKCQPLNFKTYALRPFGVSERIQFIEHILENTKNIGFVIIDGIRDLVSDINNPNESTDIVNRLMYWTEKYDCHINVVLHINPVGDVKLRGHLGTEITNKAESVILIEKSNESPNYSVISPFQSRGKEFDPFSFFIDNYIPVIDLDKTIDDVVQKEVPF